MSSPVNASDFAPLTNQATVCQRLGALINGYNAMGEFLDWFLDDNNEVSDEALAGMGDRLIPIGTILMWSSEILPSGNWLICNGLSYAKADYEVLANRLGTTYGIPESDPQAKMFKVPDLSDRFPVGAGKAYALSSTGGEKEVVLEEGNMPEHFHFFELEATDGSGGSGRAGLFDLGDAGLTNIIKSTHQTQVKGAGLAHENRPPFIALRFIIKAL